jgi:hypothetical protein
VRAIAIGHKFVCRPVGGARILPFGAECMPSLRRRFLAVGGTDAGRRRSYLRAWQWARQRLSDHEIHVEGSAVRLFPTGGLDAAARYSDEELRGFAAWVVFAYTQYAAFL